WQKRIEQPSFAALLYADTGYHLLPVSAGMPRGMLKPPDPQTRRQINNLHVRRDSLVQGHHCPRWPSRDALSGTLTSCFRARRVSVRGIIAGTSHSVAQNRLALVTSTFAFLTLP